LAGPRHCHEAEATTKIEKEIAMIERTKSEQQSLIDATRGWGNILRLWRLCPRAACARARACKGNAGDCFPRHFKLLPPGVQEWWLGIGEAQKEGLSFDDAMEWLEAEGCCEALRQWYEAVDQSLAKSAATQH
jgi:hypothetical protein